MATKKLYLMIAFVVILALILGSCAQATTQAPVTQAPTTPPQLPELKIGIGYVGPISDFGWTWSHDQGIKAMEAKFPNVKSTVVESLPYSQDASATIEQFIADGAKMIIINSGYGDLVTTVAQKYPDVAFLMCTSYHEEWTAIKNLVQYYPQEPKGAYLAGVAAGLLTKTGKLGFIGPYPSPVVTASANAFTLGARSVNPNATTTIVFVNSWFDPTATRQASEGLIDNGVDFLMGILDDATYLQVAEERGVLAAPENSDMRRFGPKAYVTSVIYDWSPFYISEVQALEDGTWKGGRGELLPFGKVVQLDTFGASVPQAVQDQVNKVRDSILNGTSPWTGPIYDSTGAIKIAEGQSMSDWDVYTNWTWAVQGLIGLEQ